VTEARDRLRGPRSVSYRYAIDGTAYEGNIFGSESYRDGEPVTVYVDPADHSSSTLAGEQPQSRPTYFLMLVMVTAALVLLLLGLQGWWRIWRRRRA